MVIEVTLIGFLGISPPSVATFSIFLTTGVPSTTFPNTGCLLAFGPDHQSRFLLLTVFMKNWLPPELGPALAIDSVNIRLLSLAVCSSSMHPSLLRVTVEPSYSSNVLLGGGPPVPASRLVGFFECGQPNWSMNPLITRWKCSPS